MGWLEERSSCFVFDPYGMEVEWATLESVSKTRAIDVWFLFSLSGLYRQATRSDFKIDTSKREAITRILGTEDWMRELYSDLGQKRLFDDVPLQRSENVKGLEAVR